MSDEKMKLKGKLGVEGHEGERVPVCDEAGNVIGHAVIGPSGWDVAPCSLVCCCVGCEADQGSRA